jgi:O-antigen ligase
MGTSLSVGMPSPRRRDLALGYGALLVIAAVLGTGIAAASLRYELSLPMILAGGLGLMGALALTLARYEVAVALGFALMAVVNVEPAPPDAMFAVIVSVALVTGRFDVSRVPRAALACVGAFVFLNIVSAVDALDPARAAFFFGITLYLCVFSVWFAAYLDSVRRARLVVLAYLGAAVISALLGSFAIITHLPGTEFLLGDGDTRAKALFKDANVFGPFLVPIALIVLEETMRARLLRSPAMFKRLLFLVLLVGVLFSYSRAAWLNLVVGTVVMLVVLALRRRSGGGALRLLGVLFVATAVLAATVMFTSSADFLQERAKRQAYDSERFGGQRLGLQFGQEHPVGIGPGQFEERSPISAHSTYVRVFAEQGLLGFLTIVALLLATLIFALRNAALGRDSYGIGSAALLGAWCGILANSFVVDTLHWRHLWVVAALVWVGSMKR